MHRLRFLAALVVSGGLLGCGSSGDSTSPPTNNSGSGRTMTASYSGVDFKPTLLTSAYLNGQVSVNANDGTRSLLINAINITANGTYSLAPGNANSALAQWIDGNTGTFSTGAGGTGTVTFTVLQLGRVAGSFAFTAKNTGTGSTATVALIGTFDIKFP